MTLEDIAKKANEAARRAVQAKLDELWGHPDRPRNDMAIQVDIAIVASFVKE